MLLLALLACGTWHGEYVTTWLGGGSLTVTPGPTSDGAWSLAGEATVPGVADADALPEGCAGDVAARVSVVTGYPSERYCERMGVDYVASTTTLQACGGDGGAEPGGLTLAGLEGGGVDLRVQSVAGAWTDDEDPDAEVWLRAGDAFVGCDWVDVPAADIGDDAGTGELAGEAACGRYADPAGAPEDTWHQGLVVSWTFDADVTTTVDERYTFAP